MWADPENVRQDELFGRGFAEYLSCVPSLRRKKGFEMLSANLAYDGVAELGEYVGQA